MIYELREYCDPSSEPLETAATLDHARIRAKNLSALPENDFWIIVLCVDNRQRYGRALAFGGRIYWAAECKACRGKGWAGKTACWQCMCTGSVVGSEE